MALFKARANLDRNGRQRQIPRKSAISALARLKFRSRLQKIRRIGFASGTPQSQFRNPLFTVDTVPHVDLYSTIRLNIKWSGRAISIKLSRRWLIRLGGPFYNDSRKARHELRNWQRLSISRSTPCRNISASSSAPIWCDGGPSGGTTFCRSIDNNSTK